MWDHPRISLVAYFPVSLSTYPFIIGTHQRLTKMHQTEPYGADEEGATSLAPSAIVPQDSALPQTLAWSKRLPPAALRVSLLGLVLFVVWWSWPRNGESWHTAAGEAEAPAPSVGPASLAVAAVAARNLPGLAQSSVVSATAEAESPSVPIPTATEDAVAAEEPPAVAAQPETVILAAPLPTKVAVVLVPTATPTALPTEAPVQNGPSLPQVRMIPAVGIKLPPTRTPAAGSTPSGPPPTPSPTPLPIEPGRLWSSFTPAAAPENDHFWIGRPFLPSAPNQVASPSYQFGSTAGNRYRPHHGIDMSNPTGTPVIAGAEGEVVHAGPDDVELLGPYNNFYGNTVVIRLERRLTVGDGQLDVYALYGHLSQVAVAVGQRVAPGDVVGTVGMTGIAIGPHLHLEVRLGANTYRHSVNPYLWLQPLGDQGAVAVRLLTADGRTWPGARLTLARFEGGSAVWARQIETYLDTENIGPNPSWGENGAMDGAPPGNYVLVGTVNGESVRTELTVNPGQTTFVEIRTRQ